MSTVLNLSSYSAHMDYSYSRHSNNAGAALPRIPRRSPSSRSVSAPSSPPATVSRVLSAESPFLGPSTAPAVLVVQPPTPPRPDVPAQDDEASSSSSSGSESYVQMNPRTKRVRTPKMQPFRSPAESTPTPAVLKAKAAKGVAFPARQSSGEEMSGNETPRASSSQSTPRPNLHIVLDTLSTPLATSQSTLSVQAATGLRVEGSGSRTVSTPNILAANIARKKTGEPLKSSLKARRPVVRGDLSVITGVASTKSEPSTPMASKSVHFDSREHVKLFLAEQKPLAISREGSPTDTSGTESDFPSAIYGPKKDEERVLTMQVANMPAVPRADKDIALEGVSLSEDGTALNGRVRVRNIAFEKWVAVRFTVDGWQTTSEVTAKYLDSVPGGVFDRFSFTIRLSDMLARIEEKTLFFALRYNVTGREIWDNNENENYKVTFAKVARPRPAPAPSSETGLASLKSKLEHVVKGQETVGGYMSRKPAPFTLQASTSLAARYDFSVSWKSPWTRSPQMTSPTKSGHSRHVTYPHSLPPLPQRATKPSAVDDSVRGSPRMADPYDASPLERPSMYATGDLEDTPVPIMSRRRGRNHQRGYFDLGLSQMSPTVRRTPTGSPTGGSSPSKVSPERTPQGLWFVERGGSEESTPSATSNSEESSPSESPTDEGVVFGFGGTRSGSGSPSAAESDSYSVFLNKYCYYTGTSDSLLDAPEGNIHRSHSASSVEEFLSTSPAQSYLLSPGETPTRSSSYDDVVAISSGATTPTARSVGFAQAGALVNSPPLLSVAH
ncbi:putative phosphatase regulatory subunit-domain-containing protein [Earliella scabrosa]|nr:putative phosphatase regulatory subunit-domain-containing protein [Earliella scabrosa]